MELFTQQMLISFYVKRIIHINEDYDNNDTQDDYINMIYLNRRKLNFKGKE